MKVIWGRTDRQTDRPTDGRTNTVSYRGACSHLKRLRKKVALIKTDYEEGTLQPTPAGHRKGEPISTGLTPPLVFRLNL
jgi:hypothetical protein